MSAENISLPLRNVLNSVQSVRDGVLDGESNESDGAFNLSNFWDTLIQAAKTVSQEATKLSLAFSKPPLPSQQDVEKLADFILKSVLTLTTVYYWLPKSHGVSLRERVQSATVEVLNEVAQLLEVILSSPLQSLNQEQLTSTGSVWAACDQFAQLPRDNKEVLLVVLSSHTGIVKDAIEEMQQALAEEQDPFSDILDGHEEGDEPRDNRDTYWSERDRLVIGPCQGLMKASLACLKKMTAAVRSNGDVSSSQNVAQLDDLAKISKEISPGVDDLAMCLYPPMDYSGVETNVSKLALLLKKILGLVRSSHYCGESQLTWVQFLEGAVDHNLQKAQDLLHQDS